MASAGRLAGVLDRVYDLLPRALVQRGDEPPVVDRPWRAREDTWVLPRPGLADHWEAAASAEPYLCLVDAPGQLMVRLVVQGSDGVRHVGRILARENQDRLEAFVAAAGRMDDTVVTWLAEVVPSGGPKHHAYRPAPRLRPVPGRQEATAHLGAGLVRSFVDDGTKLARQRRDPDRVAWVLADAPVDPADTVDLRRVVKRVVAMWRPLAALPPELPGDLSKEGLDRELRAAYRRSLRAIGPRVDPAERAAVRAEVRRLVAAYRHRNLARPRLLQVLAERLRLD